MEYTTDDIKIISWPEPIRKRPSMYYKFVGTDGCAWLIKEVLESILNQEYSCGSDEVEIRYTRHNEIVIEYNGNGMPLQISNEFGIPEPIIYRVFMGLFAGKYTREYINKYGHLSEIGAIFNAACKVFRLTSVGEEKSYSMSFYQGCISSPLHECSNSSVRNKLQFQFDPLVLGEFEVSTDMLKNITEELQNKYKRARVKYVS